MATVTAGIYGIKYSGRGFWKTHREADSQTFVAGQLVHLSGGYVTETATNAVLCTGIAGAAATNVTVGWADIPVFHIAADTELWIQSYSTGAETHKGAFYELLTTANINYVDTSASTYAIFHVIGKSDFDAWTDTYCRYVVKVSPAYLTG